ncbi:MAG TPA: hypothetical protein VD972_37785 [Hyalangium sp.]|nr:hypothetical protein [Hyalangium sp.]HYI01762.1 hypothetical protein [Hyalangium sp.]
MRNGKGDLEPGDPGARQETHAVGPMEQHLQVASRLLSERQAPKAFGELVRASRSLPMTRRLAGALVAVSLRAGTEAAAITILTSALGRVDGAVREDVLRQLARILRRVDQLPRAIETLERLLSSFPYDHGSRRVLQHLLERTGKWEALVASLEAEEQEAFHRGEYARAAQATRWRARVQAQQMRNLARAAESYGQAANYLEQMEDADGAFAVRLDGLRVLHAAGASETVLTAAASVCMSAAARLGRDAQARQVLEELRLIPRAEAVGAEAPKEQAPSSPGGSPARPEARPVRPAATVEMSLPLLKAMLAASSSGQGVSAQPSPAQGEPAAPPAQAVTPPVPAKVQAVAPPQEVAVTSFPAPASPVAPPAEAAATPSPEPLRSAAAQDEAVSPPSLEPARAPPPQVEAAEPVSTHPENTQEDPQEAESPEAAPPEAAPQEAESQEAAPPEAAPQEAAPPESTHEEPQEAEDRSAFAAPQADEASDAFEPPVDRTEDVEVKAEDGPPMTELLEIPAEEEQAQDSEPEEAPPPVSGPWEDPAAQQRLEAHLISRKSWRELAQFYLTRADQAKDPLLRAEALTRLAELMEDELGDPSGAARIYREIVTLTGDRDALKQQVRLLGTRGDSSLVRRALDEAVQSARSPKARAAAYLTRAERALEVGEQSQAKADFETAEALTPGMLLVLAGLVRCVPDTERHIMAHRLRSALSAAPRRSPDRQDALRVLASVAEDSLKDAKLAQWAWTEVLAEEPGESQARARLLELARTLGDRAALSQLLREQLSREPRGPDARLARMELVASLEDAGDSDGALTELRHAVRFEPGHKEAWLLLADRLTERGQIGEAAWAMEHAATAMEDETERQRAWVRLASFCHNVLKDPARAEMYSRRAENLRLSLQEKSAPPVPDLPRGAAPYREGGTRTQLLIPPPGNVDLTPSGQSFPAKVAEPSTDLTDPAPNLPDHARPTIEFSAVTFPGDKMPFSEEEPTATEAPEGFIPPGSSPPAPSPEKAAPPKKAAASSKKNLGKKLEIEVLDPSRELDSLLGEDEEEAGHTSPSLSAWSMRRPALPPKAQKSDAPEPPLRGKSPAERPPAEKSTVRLKKLRPQVTEEVPQQFMPDPGAPTRAASSREDTAPGRRGSTKPPPPREAPGARAEAPSSSGSRPAVATGGRPVATGSRPAAGAPPQAAGSSGAPRGQRRESADSAFAQVSPREPESSPAYNNNNNSSSTPVQNTAFISWEAPPGKMEPVRRVARVRAGPPSPKVPPPESGSEPAVFKQVRARPLEGSLYAEIAEYFDSRDDPQRAELMREIADALEGREGPVPRLSRPPLSPDERSGLRHPILRSPSGELLTWVGVALCRLFPTHGRAAGSSERLRASLGPGAPGAIDALKSTERLLGMEAPEVVLSEDNGPPFSLVFTTSPRLLVGKQAVRQVLPAPELRFYAGRALLCLGPDLLALRSLKKDQVLRGLALLSSVLKDPNASGLEARVVRETLTAKQLERAAALYGPATRQFDVSAMADGARDSSNRAGLVACGAVGPALTALRMKRALEREVVELVRFAASERYFQLRTSR